MEYFIIVIFLVVFAIILYETFKFLKKGQWVKKQKEFVGDVELIDKNLLPKTETNKKHCPLCGSPLSKNETVKSKVYPSGQKDSIMDVFGCLYCIPPGGKKKRICPVCKKTVPENGYIIGRYFVKPNKRHLHVLGCTLCRKA